MARSLAEKRTSIEQFCITSRDLLRVRPALAWPRR
jgi:hypothetical protein